MGILNRENKRNYDSLFDNNSIKIVIIGCIAIIIALLFLSITSILIIKNAVVHKLKTNDLDNLADSIATVIESKIDRALDTSLIMANDPTMINWIQVEENDKEAEGLVKDKMKSLVNDFGYDTAFLVSDKTKHYWSYHGDSFELLDTISNEDNSDVWFFNFIKIKKEYEINIDYNKELNDTFVWINVLVGNINEPIAVTGLGMNLSEVITELIKDEQKSKVKNDIWLVDDKGVIYLSKNPTYLEKSIHDYLPDSLIENINMHRDSKKEFKIDEYKNAKGKKYDIAYKRIKDTEWKLIVQIPRTETMSFLKAVIVNTIFSCIVIIILMVGTFYLISNRIANPYKRALQLNQELGKIVAERTRELQEKNTKILESIEYAKKIQQTILPHDFQMKENLKEYFVVFKPRDIVGGDFYWMKSYDEGFLLIVGDCTGHGVPGALMTTAVNAMLNHITDELCKDNPAIILNKLNDLIKRAFKKEGSLEIISDGLDAAVLFVSKPRRVYFAGANISIFLSNGNNVREIKGNKHTIDCTEGKKEKYFENHIIDYDEKNIFYITTDGYKDQPGGEKLLPYGKKRLLALLEDITKLEMKEQKLRLIEEIEQYKRNEMYRDDITLLGFKL